MHSPILYCIGGNIFSHWRFSFIRGNNCPWGWGYFCALRECESGTNNISINLASIHVNKCFFCVRSCLEFDISITLRQLNHSVH